MPHKRYAWLPVREQAGEYLGGKMSYRQVVRHRGMPTLYDDRDGSSISAKQDGAPGLAPSTVRQWLSWLGSLQNVVREAGSLVRQKAPGSLLHREAWPISARKHRGEERRQTLQRAARGLVLEILFRELFHDTEKSKERCYNHEAPPPGYHHFDSGVIELMAITGTSRRRLHAANRTKVCS